MKNLDASVFHSLEHLELENLPELQEICDGPISSTYFQNLQELNLDHLKALTQFWKSSNVPHFRNLSSIFIEGCDSLHNLGKLSMAGKDCLPQLEYLGIRECQMMEQVFSIKGVGLYNLPNLTTFYQGIQGIEFPLLRYMMIEECPKMKSIIMARNEKSNWGDQDIDDDDIWHLFCQSEKVSCGSSLEELEMDHNPFCGHEIPSSLFNGLEALTINKYEGSTSIFTFSVAQNLVSLRKLCIRNCAEMIKVIEDDQQQQRILLFPKLEELELQDLPKLVSFCDSKCEVEFPLLWKVEIHQCPNMESFSMGLVATPSLEALITDLTTYVGVGVDVAFDSLKTLMISCTKNPFVDRKISVSLFNGLEQLRFFGCGGSMSLFSSSAIGNLVNLRVLEIFVCHIVKVIEEDEEKGDGKVVRGGVVFPKLEELHLVGLLKLVSFCGKCDVEFPSLKHVEITLCLDMENFSLGFVVAPNLDTFSLNFKHIEDAKDLNGAVQQHYLARQERIRRMKEEEGGEEEQETKDEIEEENQN